jgi:IS30 family transposase
MEQDKLNAGKRKLQQITEKERYKIESLFERGLTNAQIGESLKKSRQKI